MEKFSTALELEAMLGESIKRLRLQKNLDRKTLCNKAGISENALRHLEGGKGTTLKTLMLVVKALERESWLTSIAPQTSINPLHMVPRKQLRQRARRKKYDEKEKA